MENRIPVPTDNIFKFYALFGLVLVVFSIGAAIYNNDTTNALLVSATVEIATIKQSANPTGAEVTKVAVLERQKEIAISDRKVFQWCLAAFLAGGGYLLWYGFSKWQKIVQPRIDEMARTELAIAKLQLEKLRRDL